MTNPFNKFIDNRQAYKLMRLIKGIAEDESDEDDDAAIYTPTKQSHLHLHPDDIDKLRKIHDVSIPTVRYSCTIMINGVRIVEDVSVAPMGKQISRHANTDNTATSEEKYIMAILTTFTYNGDQHIRAVPGKQLFRSTMVHEVVNRGDIFAIRIRDQMLTIVPGNAEVVHTKHDIGLLVPVQLSLDLEG